jgi:hypothetical protein
MLQQKANEEVNILMRVYVFASRYYVNGNHLKTEKNSGSISRRLRRSIYQINVHDVWHAVKYRGWLAGPSGTFTSVLHYLIALLMSLHYKPINFRILSTDIRRCVELT